jgi:hypothetical protein
MEAGIAGRRWIDLTFQPGVDPGVPEVVAREIGECERLAAFDERDPMAGLG